MGSPAVRKGRTEASTSCWRGSSRASVRSVTARAATGSGTSKEAPPLVFGYSAPRMSESFVAAPAETLDAVTHGPDGPRYRWVDLYGEGLPVLLLEGPTLRASGETRRSASAIAGDAQPAGPPTSQVSVAHFTATGTHDRRTVRSRACEAHCALLPAQPSPQGTRRMDAGPKREAAASTARGEGGYASGMRGLLAELSAEALRHVPGSRIEQTARRGWRVAACRRTGRAACSSWPTRSASLPTSRSFTPSSSGATAIDRLLRNRPTPSGEEAVAAEALRRAQFRLLRVQMQDRRRYLPDARSSLGRNPARALRQHAAGLRGLPLARGSPPWTITATSSPATPLDDAALAVAAGLHPPRRPWPEKRLALRRGRVPPCGPAWRTGDPRLTASFT